jgi:ketosteroid isomerase-like protein
MAYHHPDVVKALSPGPLLVGKAAVEANLRGTLESFTLEFTRNEVESLLVRGDMAIEISQFAIHGTPRKTGEPFDFAGRAMVVYVRSVDSPSGWLSIRETVQPAAK